MPSHLHRLDHFIVTPVPASQLKMPARTGTSRSRLRYLFSSAAKRVDHPQEHTLPLVPRQESIQQAMAAPDDLAGHQDDRVHEPLELHPQQTTLLLTMNFLMPWVLRDRQREPRF